MDDNSLSPPSEREKWAAEQRFRERELVVAERRAQLEKEELELKAREHAAAGWKSPVVVAILAATVAGAGNAIVAYTNGRLQRDLEVTKAEHARMLEMIKTGDADKAAENLRFLVDTGLISDPVVLTKLEDFLETRKEGSGPALPAPARSDGDDVKKIQDIEVSDPLRTAANSVGQVFVFEGSRQVTKCTAFLVDVDIVLTAGYCIQFAGTSPTSYVLELGSGPSKFRFASTGAPLEVQNGMKAGQPNYALVRVSGLPGKKYGFLRLSTEAPKLDDQLAAVLYRADAQQLAAFSAFCKVGQVLESTFVHRCASGGGSAGAPILRRNGSVVVGMHVLDPQDGSYIATRADVVAAAIKKHKDAGR